MLESLALIPHSLSFSLMVALASVSVAGQNLESLPHYHSSQAVSGTIRIWGNDRMQDLMDHWQAGFRKYQPNVRLETKLLGTGTGMAGLYTGAADLALMGRYSTAKEIQAFEWVFKYRPLGVDVATGSLAAPGKA